MLNITLHPVEDVHSLHVAQSRELIMISGEGGRVRNSGFPHRVVQSYQRRPVLAAQSRHSATELRQPDVKVPGRVSVHDRIMIDGRQYWVVLDSFRCATLKPVPVCPGAGDAQDRDGDAWRALASLAHGDKLTVDLDNTTVAVIVDMVVTGGPRTEDASVICRFPRTGTRIEITHEDLVTRSRAYRHGWGADAGTIRLAAFAD